MTRRRLLHDRRAVTAVEFAIIGSALISLTFAIVETGLLYWTRGGLASVAAMTARCGATGFTWGTTTCTTADSTKNYAVSQAGQWLLPGVIASTDVTVTSASATCSSATGKFFIVSITCAYFRFLPPPFNNYTLAVTSCYPMA